MIELSATLDVSLKIWIERQSRGNAVIARILFNYQLVSFCFCRITDTEAIDESLAGPCALITLCDRTLAESMATAAFYEGRKKTKACQDYFKNSPIRL